MQDYCTEKIEALEVDYKTFVSLVDSIICIAKNNLTIAREAKQYL